MKALEERFRFARAEAYEAASMAIHWAAKHYPIALVAVEMRNIADALSDKAAVLRGTKPPPSEGQPH